MSTPTRDKILASADRLIAERGFGATSLADVAQAAGLLKGNLAYYFKTKTELLAAVATLRQSQWLERLTDFDGNNQQRLNHFLNTIGDSADHLARFGCPIGSLCSELAKDQPGLLPVASHLLRHLQHWLDEQLAGLMSNPPLTAEELLIQLQGAAVVAHAFGDPAVVHRQLNQIRRSLNLA